MKRKSDTVDALVLSDAEGNYYVVPRVHLELSKVGPEGKAEVQKQLTKQKNVRATLGDYSFVGVMTLPENTRWTHYSPDITWPN
jgi:hypothetical protein